MDLSSMSERQDDDDDESADKENLSSPPSYSSASLRNGPIIKTYANRQRRRLFESPRFSLSQSQNKPARYVSSSGAVAPLLRNLQGENQGPTDFVADLPSPSTSPEEETRPPSKSSASSFYGKKPLDVDRKDSPPSRTSGGCSRRRRLVSSGSGDSPASRSIPSASPPAPAPLPAPVPAPLQSLEPTLSHLVGFPNLGLTCYMNSVLQAILGLPVFMNKLLKLDVDLKLSNLETGMLPSIFKLAYLKDKGRVKDIEGSLEKLKNELVKINSQFHGWQMQDAHEFLMILFDSLHEEETKLTQGKETNKATVTSSIIEDNFQFEVVETRICSNCDKKIETKVKDYIFKLQPPKSEESKVTTIQELLSRSMNSRSEFQCGTCAERRKKLGFEDGHEMSHEITERFSKLPRTLILYCQRIECVPAAAVGQKAVKMSYCKNRNPVEVSDQLSISCVSTSDANLPAAASPAPLKRSASSEACKVPPKSSRMTPKAPKTPQKSSSPIKPGDSGDSLLEEFYVNFELSVPSFSKAKPPKAKPPSDGPPDVLNMSFENQMALAVQESLLTAEPSTSQLQGKLQVALLNVDTEKEINGNNNNSSGDSPPMPPLISSNAFDLNGLMNFEHFHDSNESSDTSKPVTPRERRSTDESTSTSSGRKRVSSEFQSSPVSRQPNKVCRISPIKDVQRNDQDYSLSAVISHLGATTTIESGHYVADVYNFEKKTWFRYNDACVSKQFMTDVTKDNLKDGYIYIYTHNSVPK